MDVLQYDFPCLRINRDVKFTIISIKAIYLVFASIQNLTIYLTALLVPNNQTITTSQRLQGTIRPSYPIERHGYRGTCAIPSACVMGLQPIEIYPA